MGWGNCGTDSKGRPIGYVFSATCDHPGCLKEIDRGLDYACGGMHGEDVYSCEKYFCHEHRIFVDTPDGETMYLCLECVENMEHDF